MSTLDRRSFIGRALSFSAVSGFAGAANFAQAEQLGKLQNSNLLAVYRTASADSAAFAACLAAAGIATLALQDDVVRQWRAGLEAEFVQHNKLLLGMGNWDDFTLIKGLSAEARRFPLLTMQHPLKVQQQDWASRHAQELLTLTQLQNTAELEQALESLAQRSSLQAQAPSLFSWIIG